jgi:hypothetical protein
MAHLGAGVLELLQHGGHHGGSEVSDKVKVRGPGLFAVMSVHGVSHDLVNLASQARHHLTPHKAHTTTVGIFVSSLFSYFISGVRIATRQLAK